MSVIRRCPLRIVRYIEVYSETLNLNQSVRGKVFAIEDVHFREVSLYFHILAYCYNIMLSSAVRSVFRLLMQLPLEMSPKPLALSFWHRHTYPSEPKSGGHMTITHQMLASIFQVFCVTILPRSYKT